MALTAFKSKNDLLVLRWRRALKKVWGVGVMQFPYSEYLTSSSELQFNAMKQYRDMRQDFAADLQQYAADARGKASEFWQTYFQELHAAGAGDDFAERVDVAQTKLSQAYAELDDQYVTACRSRQQSLAESQSSLNAECCQKSIDSMIQYLQAEHARPIDAASQKPASGSAKSKS